MPQKNNSPLGNDPWERFQNIFNVLLASVLKASEGVIVIIGLIFIAILFLLLGIFKLFGF